MAGRKALHMAVPADTGPYWEKIVGPGDMPVRLPSCCGSDWADARGRYRAGRERGAGIEGHSAGTAVAGNAAALRKCGSRPLVGRV